MEQLYGNLNGKDKSINLNLYNTEQQKYLVWRQEARNNLLNLPSLEDRRRRGDLIQMFQLVKNIDLIDLHNPIEFCNLDGRTRGHNLKILYFLIF